MIHLQIAEAGRRHALRGDHNAALDRYRHALRVAVLHNTNPFFLHYYTECILDGLDLAGRSEQALELVERALGEQSATEGELSRRIRAGLLERRVMLLFSLGRVAEADAALADSAPLGGPILKALQEARRRHFWITSEWLSGLRTKHGRSAVTGAAVRQADAEAGELHFMRESCGD